MSIGIYVHIPFCKKKCNYCDFNSTDQAHDSLKKEYVAALKAEMRDSEYPDEVDSVFIGGGTPTALELEDLLSIIKEIQRDFKLRDPEFTVEVNPGTMNREGFSALKEAGVNRISFGLQSVNEDELKMLGRIHTYEEFEHTYRAAREAGFSNINLDLMFSLPDQTFERWEHTLKTAVGLRPEHISCYSLTIEENTPFGKMKLNLPSEEEDRRNYDYAVSYLTGSGYHQYEISNFAKPGLECRHNLKYWQRKDYIGFGAGASSLYHNVRFDNSKDLETYIKGNDRKFQVLSKQECIGEYIVLALRTSWGVDRAEFLRLFGFDFVERYRQTIQKYEKLGIMTVEAAHCYLTLDGFSVSNRIMADFI
jgi:oxygen-independent coproporphyrinogen-3 oxidase